MTDEVLIDTMMQVQTELENRFGPMDDDTETEEENYSEEDEEDEDEEESE
jgi:hypothetical protein